VRSLTDAAAARLAATQEARKAAQVSLLASVANAYVAIAADDAQLELARRTLAAREDSDRLTRMRFDQGVASELELQSARSLAEAARVALAQARRQRKLDEDALVLLVGRPLPADLPPAPAWDGLALPDVPAGLPSEVLLQRPDVRQAEQQLIAANADIGAARAAFFPAVTLTGSYGTASTQLSRLFDHQAWSFIPQLALPIFDSGRNRANLRASEANRDIAVASYEKAIQSAFRDVADALAGRATLDEQLRAQQAQAEAESRRVALSELRLRSGVASSLELLDAQRSLFAAQQASVATQLAVLQNRIALYRALGGGWTQPARSAATR
jgi:NodT family efflux transporter outer membrane factor (OMF) lipoprotein